MELVRILDLAPAHLGVERGYVTTRERSAPAAQEIVRCVRGAR